MMALGWVRTYQDGADWVESVNGRCWGDGVTPPRWHMCFPQTRGMFGGVLTTRCDCGAFLVSGVWLERNQTRNRSRRRGRHRRRRP